MGQSGSESCEPGTLVPARIINEHVYCPRLAWFEWSANAFVESSETAEGSDLHRAVDQERGNPDDDSIVTAMTLSSERLGVIAKLDRIDKVADSYIPVETKRGKPRKGKDPLWEPERAQLEAQVLLLRENGFRCEEAAVFFAETRQRVRIEIDDAAEQRLATRVQEVIENSSREEPPAPLVDSPKCLRCSLVSICLPDEENLLRQASSNKPRRLVAADSSAKPLYLTIPGSFVRKDGGRFVLENEGKKQASKRIIDVSQLSVYGNVTLSAGVIRECHAQDIPIMWFSSGGWLSGYSVPNSGSWVQRRQSQYRLAGKNDEAIKIGRCFIEGKVRNQRTLLRRHTPRSTDGVDSLLLQLKDLTSKIRLCGSTASLLGYEGTAARLYFSGLPALLRSHGDEFDFVGRNRRPAKDPVNCLLSFAYALVVRDATVALIAAGLDPQVGFLHQPRFGRPSLALDLAEEFRPLLADSTVLMVINNGELRPNDFIRRGPTVGLRDSGRKRLILAYERRVAIELAHPVFGYKVSYRRAIELQARMLAAVVDGQHDRYVPLTPR